MSDIVAPKWRDNKDLPCYDLIEIEKVQDLKFSQSKKSNIFKFMGLLQKQKEVWCKENFNSTKDILRVKEVMIQLMGLPIEVWWKWILKPKEGLERLQIILNLNMERRWLEH